MLNYFDIQNPPPVREEIAAIAAEIVSYDLNLHIAFDILGPERDVFLYENNIPPGITYPRFADQDFQDAVTREKFLYLNQIKTEIGAQTFAQRVDIVNLAMEVGGIKNMADEYGPAKTYYNALAYDLKDEFGLDGKIGIYLGGAGDRITGLIKNEVLHDLDGWLDTQVIQNIDAFGCSWYPQGPSPFYDGYAPYQLDPDAVKAVAGRVHDAGKRLIFPEIGYPAGRDCYSTDERQARAADKMQKVVIPACELTEDDRVIWFVLVDENFRIMYPDAPILTFNSMGLANTYNPDETKLAWETWLEGVTA